MKTRSFLFACLFAAGVAASTAEELSVAGAPKLVTIAGAQGSQIVILPPNQKFSRAKTAPAALSKSAEFGFARSAKPPAMALVKAAPAAFEKSAPMSFVKTAPAALSKSAEFGFARSAKPPAMALVKAAPAAFEKSAPMSFMKFAPAALVKFAPRSLALAPGRSRVLGPTAGTTLVSTTVPTAGTDTIVVTARGNAATALGAGPLSATIQRQVFVGDLVRTTPREDAGSTGAFAPGVALVIGPNGFPVPVTAAAQSGANPIGPNGFPTNVAPFAQTGLTRGGTSRDTSVPVTLAPSTVGAVSVGVVGAPGAAFSAPATSAPSAGATISTASPR